MVRKDECNPVGLSRRHLLNQRSRLMRRLPISTSVASTALAGLAGLHAAWGVGLHWPFPDRASFADATYGTTDAPSSLACFAVAGALGVAAALVGGHPQRTPLPRRAGVGGVAVIFSARGVLGLLGRTNVVSPASTSERFRRLDRRCYAPLCLVLAVLCLPAIGRR